LRDKFLLSRGTNNRVHPVQAIQSNWCRDQKELKYFGAENTFGSHMPIRLQMEEAIVLNHQRHRFTPSSSIALETLLGEDELIFIEDIYSHPDFSEEFEENAFNNHMEKLHFF